MSLFLNNVYLFTFTIGPFIGIEKDAVSIYSKYISLDATHAIGITEELRNEAISKSDSGIHMIIISLS